MLQRALSTAITGIVFAGATAAAQHSTIPEPNYDMSDLYNHSSSTTSKQRGLEAGSAATSSGGIASTPEKNSKTNDAINTERRESRTAAAPVPGRNSFTEREARRRLESFGYTNVSDLKKDEQGIWRGRAARNGQSMDIALDYQGNIVGNHP